MVCEEKNEKEMLEVIAGTKTPREIKEIWPKLRSGSTLERVAFLRWTQLSSASVDRAGTPEQVEEALFDTHPDDLETRQKGRIKLEMFASKNVKIRQ